MTTNRIDLFFRQAQEADSHIVFENLLYRSDRHLLEYTFFFANAKREYRNAAEAMYFIANDIRRLLGQAGINVVHEVQKGGSIIFHLEPKSLIVDG